MAPSLTELRPTFKSFHGEARVPNQKYVAYFAGPPRRLQRCLSSEYFRHVLVEAPCRRRAWLAEIDIDFWFGTRDRRIMGP